MLIVMSHFAARAEIRPKVVHQSEACVHSSWFYIYKLNISFDAAYHYQYYCNLEKMI